MKKKKLLCIVLAGIMLAFGSACSGKGLSRIEEDSYQASTVREEKEVYAVSYDIIGGKDAMPIGAFYGPFTASSSINGQAFPDYVSEEYFRLFDAAGVNLLVYPAEYYNSNPSSVTNALELAEQYNMGYFVMHSYFNTVISTKQVDMAQLASIIKQFTSYASFVGIHTVDEPTTVKFEGMGVLNDAFYSLGVDGIHTYANLYPTYYWQINYTGGTEENITYEEYVDRYINTVHPRFLSYDHYVFESYDGSYRSNVDYYFQNLSLIRQKAEQYRIPFWVFVQAGGHWNDSSQEIPKIEHFPNEGEFMWNVSTQLAYGAKGIQYFPLLQPNNFAMAENGEWDFGRNGLIGTFGNLNQWYFYAQKVNQHIESVDNVLMNAANEGVIASGAAKADIESLPEYIASGKYYELENVSGDALVGCFNYHGKTALYAVNYSMTDKQTIQLSFDKNYGYEVTQRMQTVEVAGNQIPLTLEAGEGALIVLK